MFTSQDNFAIFGPQDKLVTLNKLESSSEKQYFKWIFHKNWQMNVQRIKQASKVGKNREISENTKNVKSI